LGFDAGDVDADGDMDLFVGMCIYSGPHGVASPAPPKLLLNNGAGVFVAAPPAALPAGSMAGQIIRLADLDGDGDLDAFCGSTLGGAPGTAGYAPNLGGGVFAAPIALPAATPPTAVTSADLGDFDGDGRIDVVVTGYDAFGAFFGHVHMNSAAGFLPAVVWSAGTSLYPSLAAGDWDGDGTDELLTDAGSCTSTSCSATLFDVLTTGVVGPILGSWPGLAFGVATGLPPSGFASCADLDGDGDRDFFAKHGGRAALLMNTSSAAPPVVIGGRTKNAILGPGVVAGDVDFDGDADLISFDSLQPVRPVVSLNDGHGFFGDTVVASPPTALSLFGAPSLLPFDMDGDADVDLCLFARGATPAHPPTVLGCAAGVFSTVATLPSIPLTNRAAACDLDADGRVDLFFGLNKWDGTAGPMQFCAGLPTGFAAPTALGGSHSTEWLSIGDFNGDGNADLLQLNLLPYGLTGPPDDSVVYLGGPGGPTAVPQPSLSGYAAVVGDFDGDGLDDVVVDAQVRFGAASGVLGVGPSLPTTFAGIAATAADLDGDGDADLVGNRGLMRNLGFGSFGTYESFIPSPAVAASYLTDVAPYVGDLDRDGDLDVHADGIVFSNVTRQIASGALPRPGRVASLDLYGSPNGAYWLFFALAPANLNNALYGPVLIQPSTAQFAGAGVFAPDGMASISALVPNNPALVGLNLYWQALDGGTLHVTNRHVLTVYGY
jgi:hypothetical protein